MVYFHLISCSVLGKLNQIIFCSNFSGFFVFFLLSQASSDLGVLDYEIPTAYTFVMAAGVELVAIIAVMVSVTWEVLIVGILATVASKYVQVSSFF